jgi:enhancing lycopene biosynthesis protein 2
MSRVGIILSGCGFYDGTEVGEAVLAALAVERAGARVIWLAPEVTQMHTIDHLTGSEVEGERREVLAEAARLARGRVRSLAEQHAAELTAVIIPGGHGAVKNLMTSFADLGSRREVLPSVRELLAAMLERRSPIGSISLGRTVVQTFLGEPLSGDDMQVAAGDVVVDEARRLAFTPGFLTGTSLAEVSSGIEKLVHTLLHLSTRELHVIH